MACIGIDFDNTLVCYDALFFKVAIEKDLIDNNTVKTKEAVKAAVQSHHGHAAWVALQSVVYGERILEATPFPGTQTFLSWCKTQNIHLKIISHKTQRAVANAEVDLHKAARAWLAHNDLLRLGGIADTDVSFHETRREKVAEIARAQCDIFIDDLWAVLSHAEFPKQTKPVLFENDATFRHRPEILHKTGTDPLRDKPSPRPEHNGREHSSTAELPDHPQPFYACTDWSGLLEYCKREIA